MDKSARFPKRLKLPLKMAAAVTGTLIFLYLLCGLLLTTKTVNGWHGLLLAAELKLTGKPYAKMSDEPLRYFTRNGDGAVLGEIEGAVLGQTKPCCSGLLYLDGQVYEFGGGSFTRQFWVWVLKPVDKGPDAVVSSFIQEYAWDNKDALDADSSDTTLEELNDSLLKNRAILTALASKLEEHFGVDLPAEEIAVWNTPEDIAASVVKRL